MNLWWLARMLFTFAYEAAGASGARLSLRPPFSGRPLINDPGLDRAAGRRGYGLAEVPWKFTHPHHILHKYQAATASAWPVSGDVVSRKHSFDRHN